MHTKSREEILDAICFLAKFVQQLYTLDCMVSITDMEKFISYYPGQKIDVKVEVNTSIPKEDIITKVLETGQRIVAEVPKEAYGFAFKGIVNPIKDNNGEVIGTFNVGIDLTAQDELIEMAEGLSASFEQISASSQELSSSAVELSSMQSELVKISQETELELKNTSAILAVIDNVAKQTNLLGLNAAIESARAGEHGRGFAVVAEEIRKLSINTSDSTKEIKEILEKINNELNFILDNINKTEAISRNQAAAINEITTAIQENTSVAEKLVSLSQIL